MTISRRRLPRGFLLQIDRLWNRLGLTDITQYRTAISFVLALGAIIAAYFNERVVSRILFRRSILLMIGLMLLFNREIQNANTALDIRRSDLETQQKWEQYPKPMCRSSATKK